MATDQCLRCMGTGWLTNKRTCDCAAGDRARAADAIAVKPAPARAPAKRPTPTTDQLMRDVLAVLQRADEIGGPSIDQYVEFMRKVAEEATARADNAERNRT